MNQILSIDNNTGKSKNKVKKNKNNGPIEITKIIKFFSISMIIFGVFFIGTGSYSMYKESQNSKVPTKPTISVETLTENSIKLKVTHDKEINKLTYKWNDEDETQILGNGRKSIEEQIQIPTGTNTLNIYAIDVNGQEVTYKKSYTLEGDITINEFEINGNNIKITATGVNELSYMTYRWDEEEETKVNINHTSLEQEIEVPKGLHKLTVVVVDNKNTTQTKSKDINGVTKPNLEVTTDGSENFIIKASSEEGLEKVEFIIDETEKNMLNLDGKTELDYSSPLHNGENKLEVTVYDKNGVKSTFKAKLTK